MAIFLFVCQLIANDIVVPLAPGPLAVLWQLIVGQLTFACHKKVESELQGINKARKNYLHSQMIVAEALSS